MDGAARTSSEWLRQHAPAALALLVAIVVLAGALKSGASFIYCDMVQSFQHAPCCAHRGHAASPNDADADADHPQIDSWHLDCCTSGKLATVPSGEIVRMPAPPRVPLAILPFLRDLGILAIWGGPPVETFRRAPLRDPPSPSASRTRLMVFLT